MDSSAAPRLTITSPISEAMRRDLVTCLPETELRAVARLMAENRIHAVVVVDLDESGERSWGIVSDQDIVGAASEDPDETTAAQVAATELLVVRPDETIERAAQLMAEHSASHIVVVDSEDRPVGILSTLDVAGVLAG
jgi:CBS domain-containing protein